MKTPPDREKPYLMHESDRGAVLVGSAVLDDSLTDLLQSVFDSNGVPKEYVRRMLDPNGPLATFNSKILLCYGMGLISRETFDDLNTVRTLRNKFAHTTAVVDFQSAEIVSTVKSLRCANRANETMDRLKKYNLPPDEVKNDHELFVKGFYKVHKAMFDVCVFLLKSAILRHQIESTYKLKFLRLNWTNLEGRTQSAAESGAPPPERTE